MAISADQLDRIGTALAQAGGVDFAELRRDLPGLSVTRCDPSDMADEDPFRDYPGFDLYLVDGRDHCVQLCRDPAIATGIVVVARKQPRKGGAP